MLRSKFAEIVCCLVLTAPLLGCGTAKSDPAAEAPPAAHVEQEQDPNVVEVDNPDQFPLVVVAKHLATSQLVVTGAISADISRNVPVVSLASGRVVDIHARLGDTVEKGQLLLSVRSDDVASGYADYRKALADETLAHAQLDRSKDLYAHGAISLNDLQVTQDAADKATVDVQTAADHLRLLGNDPDHPSAVVEIRAPISGVITDQQVTNAGGVQALGSNPFTISDLSYVWIVCDVHENDLPSVRLGDTADIRLTAYPGRVFKGTISNIGEVLDPNLRTAKVRIEVANPGIMRLGMFVTATFHGRTEHMNSVIPTSAILHLHDRDWVFTPAASPEANGANGANAPSGGNGTNSPKGKFLRVEVTSGVTLPGNMQEVLSGIEPGTRVVANALVLENTVEQ